MRFFHPLRLLFFLPYQTSHLCSGFMGALGWHWKALANSLELDRTPMTLNLAGEWGSSRIWSFLVWGVDAEHQTYHR